MSSRLIEREACPACQSRGKDTSADNLAVYDDGHKYCFACGYTEGLSSFPPEECTFEYLPHRGLTRKTLEKYDIKTKVAPDGKPLSVGFKYPFERLKIREWDRKEYHWEPSGDTSSLGLFARDKFTAGSNDAVIITEGEYDAPSFYQVLEVPAVSVHSAATAARDVAVDRPWVDSFKRIYLAFDADSAGRAALAAVARMFDYNRVFVIDLLRDDRKDGNDYLQAGEGDVLRTIFANAKRYLPDTVVAVNPETTLQILTEEVKPGIPWPLPSLTDMTHGLQLGRSYCIKAMEGVGKTELMHAIEYQLLQGTEDNVAAIFIEEPKRDHLQTLASIHLQRPVELPLSGSAQDEVLEACSRATVMADRLFLYSHFGSDDPDVFLDTIRWLVTARNVRWVLLDHIGMVSSGIAEERDQQRALEYFSTRIEMLVKELDFGLIFVSHVNDFGQTRGSRMISKIADVVIEMSRDVLGGSNIVEFAISKNRPPLGKTGPAGSYLFDPYTKRYTQHADGDSHGYTFDPPTHPSLGRSPERERQEMAF